MGAGSGVAPARNEPPLVARPPADSPRATDHRPCAQLRAMGARAQGVAAGIGFARGRCQEQGSRTDPALFRRLRPGLKNHDFRQLTLGVDDGDALVGEAAG